MSLFDIDDDDFATDTSNSSIHSGSNVIDGDGSSKIPSEPTLPISPSPHRRISEPPFSNTNTKHGQFTLTESEIRNAQQDRKRALERRLASRMGVSGCRSTTLNQPVAHTTGSVPLAGNEKTSRGDSSVFGNSIAAALRLRKEEQEELLLRKLRTERSNDPDLLEKDLEVGVFVTSAYKQMLRRHQKRQSSEDNGVEKTSDEPTDPARREENNDDDDPLEAYIRRLERNQQSDSTISEKDRPLGLSSSYVGGVNSYVSESKILEFGTHYDQTMLMRLCEDARASEKKQEKQGLSVEDSVSPPSLSELETLVLTGGVESAAGSTAEDKEMLPSDAVDVSAPGVEDSTCNMPNLERGVAFQNEALIEHKRTLFLAREARKRRRADATFIDGCARRCEERMIKALNMG